VLTPLSYRAELANQVIVRLRRFDEATWLVCEARLTDRRKYYNLAYHLAHHAVQQLETEFGPELVRVILLRLGDMDAWFGADTEELVRVPTLRHQLARGAVLAVTLHDSRCFNEGAFAELFGPIATVIDFAELEATVRAALSAGEATKAPDVARPNARTA
jgi:hypothetical protein